MGWVFLKLIAIAEVVVGVIAFVLACTALKASIHTYTSLVFFLIEIVFAFGVAILMISAGFLMFFGSPRGLRLSIAAQSMQVLQLTTHPLTYHVVMGYALTVFVRGSGFIGVSAALGDIQALLSFGNSYEASFGVNFAAVAVSSFLMREGSRSEAKPALRAVRR
jgi:hypothetical protein